MQAAVIRKYGNPTVFQLESIAEPTPGPHEVKIRVAASSVNPVDWKVRSGAIAILSGWRFPRVLGADFSGTVVQCGPGVTEFAPGDEVFGFSPAMRKAGAYAEYMCCPVSKMAQKPTALSHLEAATVPLAGSTAYQALYKHAGLHTGMRVLITGATGGVGHFAVQMAKAAGCEVHSSCHSRNADLARRLGCDEVFAYDQTDFRKTGQRYDIIFDAAAKYGYFSCRKALARHGTYVTTLPNAETLFLHGLFFLPGKKARFVGVAAKRADLEFLSGLCNSGALRPFLEHTFFLSQLADAHTLSETEKVRGKIAIRVAAES